MCPVFNWCEFSSPNCRVVSSSHHVWGTEAGTVKEMNPRSQVITECATRSQRFMEANPLLCRLGNRHRGVKWPCPRSRSKWRAEKGLESRYLNFWAEAPFVGQQDASPLQGLTQGSALEELHSFCRCSQAPVHPFAHLATQHTLWSKNRVPGLVPGVTHSVKSIKNWSLSRTAKGLSTEMGWKTEIRPGP